MRQYKISFEEYLKMNDLLLGRKKYVLQVLFILAAVGILAVVFFFERLMHIEVPIAFQILSVGVVVFVLIATQGRTQRKGLKKSYYSNKGFQETIKVEFTDTYIEWRTDSGSHKMYWKDIYDYKSTREILVILSGESLGRGIPMRVFENDRERKMFFDLLYEKAPKK